MFKCCFQFQNPSMNPELSGRHQTDPLTCKHAQLLPGNQTLSRITAAVLLQTLIRKVFVISQKTNVIPVDL